MLKTLPNVLLLLMLVILPIKFAFAEYTQKQNEYKLVIKPTDKETISIKGTLPLNPSKLREMGIADKINPEEYTRLLMQLRLISVAQPGLVIGVSEYKCDSETNQCSCNNTDFWDCSDLLEKECGGVLTGSDGNICVLQPGTCTCRWHFTE